VRASSACTRRDSRLRAQHGKSGVRADNGPNYYAAFLLDPDGNNVESLWLR